jgi:uncharacterized protein
MNKLSSETSPYLLQHKNNPVHWYPWCEEAFEKATIEDIPIIVSIGYSSCHWCHVMEHESFENEEVAQIMNTHFVNIKVDREEYPDIDHLYMDAVQAMTGSGGWPLNVFLTPEKKPFYGGTYFPPQRMHNRASWKEVLINVSQFFSQNREEVEAQAQKLMDHISSMSHTSLLNTDAQEATHDAVIEMSKKIMLQADRVEGGFGHAPKFPSTHALNFLMNQYALYQDEDALQHVLLSLDKMAMGGIYDHVGGGFARYSTDTYWIAPHFEKMLYDNALLLEVYATAFHITKKELYLNVIDETVAWLQREMMSEEGGFYSAQDADSEGVEGKFYTWQHAELETILAEDYSWFASYFNIRTEGNWEHTNILYTTANQQEALDLVQKEKLKIWKQKLLALRGKRIRPLTDDKILLCWNALMNKALVKASIYCNRPEYVLIAEKNMAFLLQHFQTNHSYYFRTYKNGQAKIHAYADDLAYWIDSLIEISQITAKATYIIEAKKIMNCLWGFYKKHDDILFQFAHTKHAMTGFQKEEIYDGATPSSNAIICKCLRILGLVFQHTEWDTHARQLQHAMLPLVNKHPSSFALWAIEFQKEVQTFLEICISGREASIWYKKIRLHKLLPHTYFVVSERKQVEIPSLHFSEKKEETTVTVCQGTFCSPPESAIAQVLQRL